MVAVPRAGLVDSAGGSAGQRRSQSDLARPRAAATIMVAAAVVFGLVAALVAGAAFVASSVGVAARVTAAARYLPSDGAVSYERTDTTRELKTNVGIAVTESARLSGVAGLLSTDSAFATKMLDVAYRRPRHGFRSCGPRQPRSMIRRPLHRPSASIESMPAWS